MSKRVMPVPPEAIVTSGFGPRWGTQHRGVDFGREGGSAGMPVFAAQAGTVVYCGAAGGFGGPDPAGWVVIDHPTEAGSGTTVYGHIIREVHAGQRVEAGQRIGHVNPSSATNGGVAPHLHFEVHPTVWRQGSQIDPLPWLRAAAPATPSATASTTSTIFGVDVSEHQNGMSLARAAAEGIKFCIVRTTDGTYRDRTYRSHLDDAERAGLVTAAYHYLRHPREGTSIRQQVEASLTVMGDARRPVWLDCETEAGLHPDHIREAKRLFEAAGVRVPGVYSYVPWWEGRVEGGEPDTHEFGAVWVASYGANRAGPPSGIYPGDRHRQWDYPLGNQKPTLWQFGSNAEVAGYKVDINAYRGTVEELRSLFYGGPRPQKGDLTVDQADRIIKELKDYIDVRLTGPVGSDVKDIRQQLTGGRDRGEFPGWEQLGQTPSGENLTVVDAIAALRRDIAALPGEIAKAMKGAK